MRQQLELSVDIGGKKYLITSDDEDYLKAIKNGFEPNMVDLFRVLATKSETILDIGANIGCTGLLFSDLGEQVYAFEASPTTFVFLEKNLAKAGKENIFPQNTGVGEEAGESTLTFSPSMRAGGFVSNHTKATNDHVTEKIIIKPLDALIDTLGIDSIDFIKIDVEGFEGHVLRGAKRTLSTHKPIVVLELNHWCLNAFQRTSLPDFFDFLRETFPILLAIDGSTYMDLHNKEESYIVMYHHILFQKFQNILAAFQEDQIRQFRSRYIHEFVPQRHQNRFIRAAKILLRGY